MNSNVSLNFEDTSRSNRVYILSDNVSFTKKEIQLLAVKDLIFEQKTTHVG